MKFYTEIANIVERTRQVDSTEDILGKMTAREDHG